MDRPESCPEDVYGLAMRCWDEKPANRPTFGELLMFFDDGRNFSFEYSNCHICLIQSENAFVGKSPFSPCVKKTYEKNLLREKTQHIGVIL